MFNRPVSKNFAILGMLLKIQVTSWFTNYMNLVDGLAVALYTMVCWLAFKQGDPFLLVSGISVGILRNGMIIYTNNLIEWKTANTNEKLALTPTPPLLFGFAIVFFNFVTTVGISLIMFVVAIAFFPDQRDLLAQANWLIVFSAFILVWLTSLALGLLCYKFIPNLVYARMTMLMMYTLAVYLLGLGFPIETVLSYEWLGALLYAFPHRFAINLAQAGFANWHGEDGLGSILKIEGMPIHNSDNPLSVDFGYQGHLWLAYLAAIVVLIVYFGVSTLKIWYESSFHRRNIHGELVVSQRSSRYLRSLKKASDFQQVQLLYKARIKELESRSPELKEIINQVQHEVWLFEKIKRKKSVR